MGLPSHIVELGPALGHLSILTVRLLARIFCFACSRPRYFGRRAAHGLRKLLRRCIDRPLFLRIGLRIGLARLRCLYQSKSWVGDWSGSNSGQWTRKRGRILSMQRALHCLFVFRRSLRFPLSRGKFPTLGRYLSRCPGGFQNSRKGFLN